MSEPLFRQEALVRSFVDLVMNQRQLRLLPDFISLDILEYSPFILSASHDSRDFAHDIQRVFTAFADLSIAVSQVINAPGRVALRFTLAGCNTGPLPWTAQPTQRRAAWSAMAMLTLEGGRISEIRGVADRFSMLDQLGLGGMAQRT